MPLVLLAIGMGTFVLVGIAGLSVIERYLLVPSLIVHDLRGAWRSAAGRCCAAARLRTGVDGGRRRASCSSARVFTATRVNLSRFDTELQFRGDVARARS